MTNKLIKNQVIELRKNGLSCTDISKITGIIQQTVSMLCKNIELTKEQKSKIYSKGKWNTWSNKEIDFLKISYPVYGLPFCANNLKRSRVSIWRKANKLGLVSPLKYCKENKIVQRLDSNKVLSNCKVHGIVLHYDRFKGSLSCSLCLRDKSRKYRKTERGKEVHRKGEARRKKNPIYRLICNFRSRLNCYYYGKNIHFKDLGYSGLELKNHLDKIKNLQNNRCPVCLLSYDKVKSSIDHIIPTITAKSKEDVIKLFNLSNLWLLCKNCNSSKNDNNFEKWLNERKNYVTRSN